MLEYFFLSNILKEHVKHVRYVIKKKGNTGCVLKKALYKLKQIPKVWILRNSKKIW